MITVKDLTSVLSTESNIVVNKLSVECMFNGKARQFFNGNTYKSVQEEEVIRVEHSEKGIVITI